MILREGKTNFLKGLKGLKGLKMYYISGLNVLFAFFFSFRIEVYSELVIFTVFNSFHLLKAN